MTHGAVPGGFVDSGTIWTLLVTEGANPGGLMAHRRKKTTSKRVAR